MDQLIRLALALFHPARATVVIGRSMDERARTLSAEGFNVTACVTSTAEPKVPDPDRGLPLHSTDWPDLQTLPTAGFENLLCAGGLDGVRREDLITAIFSLSRVLAPQGRLLLTIGVDLQVSLPPGKLVLLLEAAGFTVLERTQSQDGEFVIAAEKSPLDAARGLERIQRVLVQDRKFATYKYALVRALCGIARNTPHVVRWGDQEVYVPIWFVAQRWLAYYWPICTAPRFIAQRRGEVSGGDKPIAFRPAIQELAKRFGPGGLQRLLSELEANPGPFQAVLREIASTVRDGPVTHAGSEASPIFNYTRAYPPGTGGMERPFGWIIVPEAIWLDICRFHHWIEDSLILRWAQLTVEMNPHLGLADVLPHLTYSPYQERDTTEVRALLDHRNGDLSCVWTGKRLVREYAVDHVIPFSVWGNNDWWNLLPSDAKVNGQKSDSLPTRILMRERRESIADYWRLYFTQVPNRFGQQVERSLGLAVGHTGWERLMFAGFQETVERVAAIHGLERWEP